MQLRNGIMEKKKEPVESLFQSVERERRQSRIARLLIANVAAASLAPSDADLEELDEEDIWEAAGRDVGRDVGDGVTVKRNSNPNLLRLVPGERNAATTWGIGGNIRRQRSLDKDSCLFGLAVGRMNGFSGTSPQENGSKSPSGRRPSREGAPRRAPSTASRMIPRGAPIEETARRAMQHQSAPLNIPDWSKILKMEKPNKAHIDVSDDDREGEEERLPPHELLSREYAKSQMYSFSVFEGAGRTLRGRDLSRVRNAILTRTGFLE